MDLTRVILGQIVTEKSERLKAQTPRTYTLRVHADATKVDIAGALRKYFDVEVEGVRIARLPAKTRLIGKGVSMEKRHPLKKAIVTLSSKSKPLDLAAFKTISF